MKTPVIMLLIICLHLAILAGPVSAQSPPKKISVATWNLEWFFDNDKRDNGKGLPQELSAPSRDEWEWKLKKVADAVAEMKPTILALQEVEDRDVVWDLCKALKERNLNYRYAFVGGYEFATEQDVAIIYEQGCCVEYGRKEQTMDMYKTKKYYNLGKHMFARFQWGTGEEMQELLVYNVHMRASADREEIRKRQCRLVREWAQDSILAGENVVVLGDFNTEHNAGMVVAGSDIEIMKGSMTETKGDDLFDLNEQLPDNERETHMIGKQFDRILASATTLADNPGKTDLVFSKIVCRKDLVVVGEKDKDHYNRYYDIPQSERDISDHYPVMAEFLFK